MVAIFVSYSCYKHYIRMGMEQPCVSLILPKQELIEPELYSDVNGGLVTNWRFVSPKKESKVLYDSHSRPIMGTNDILFPYVAKEFTKHLASSPSDTLLIATYPNHTLNFQLFTILKLLDMPSDVAIKFPKGKPFITCAETLVSEYDFLTPSAYLMCRWKHLSRKIKFPAQRCNTSQTEFDYIVSNPISLTLINCIPISSSENTLKIIYKVLETNGIENQAGLNWLQRSYAASYIRSMIDGFAKRGLIERNGLEIRLTKLGSCIASSCSINTSMLCKGLYTTQDDWAHQIDFVQNMAIDSLSSLAEEARLTA